MVALPQVALGRDFVFVGAPDEDKEAGAVYSFRRSGSGVPSGYALHQRVLDQSSMHPSTSGDRLGARLALWEDDAATALARSRIHRWGP